MNKTGKTNPVFWIVGIVVVALFFGLIELPSGTIGGGAPDADGNCQLAPSISWAIVDGVNTGTAVTPTSNYTRVGDVYKGASIPSFAYADEGEIILSATNYLDKKVDFGPLGCGVNSMGAQLYATDDSTIKVFTDVGTLVGDDVAGGATTNQSASATVIDQEIKLVAGADQSSGDLVCVLEADNTTQVDNMVLSGASKVGTPEFYSVAGAGSVTFTYEVPALIDGDSKTYNLKISPESGETIDGTGIYFTCYSKQNFVDTDGSFQYGVEDSDGTTKYEDDFDYDWLIT